MSTTFSGQARGKRLNELTERYYHLHPRGVDAEWPSQGHPLDPVLSELLFNCVEMAPDEIERTAQRRLFLNDSKEHTQRPSTGVSSS